MRDTDPYRWNMQEPLKSNPSPGINWPNYSGSARINEPNDAVSKNVANPRFDRWGIHNPSDDEICLSPTLLEMIWLRAAILNKCQICIDQHTERLAFFDERANRIDQLKCWKESNLFTKSERAALELTDVLCAADPTPISNTINSARQYFNEAEMLKIILIVLASHESSH